MHSKFHHGTVSFCSMLFEVHESLIAIIVTNFICKSIGGIEILVFIEVCRFLSYLGGIWDEIFAR